MSRLRMMLVSILVAAGLTVACGADEPPSLVKLGLKGTIRAVSESDLADNISPSEPKGTAFHVRTYHFSADGDVLLVEDCVSECERTEYLWQLGRLVEERHQFENQLPERTVRYVRDSEGGVEEEQTFENGNLECTTRFHKDSLQDQKNEYCGELLTKSLVRKHDEAASEDLVSQYIYSYDTRKEILETQYNERKVTLHDGTMKTEQLVGGTVRVSTTRDSMGRILEEVRASETAYHRETHQFDGSGREVEKAEWARDGTNINRRTYLYVNDAQGNWIRRTELFSSPAMSEPVEGEVTVRAIEYY